MSLASSTATIGYLGCKLMALLDKTNQVMHHFNRNARAIMSMYTDTTYLHTNYYAACTMV